MKSLFSKINQKKSIPKGVIPKTLITKYLPPNAVIVEAGAHIGIDTVEMAKLWRNSEIHAFEPVPSIYERLIKNTSMYSNVYCYPLALNGSTGEAKIFISGGASDGSSSLLPPKEHLRIHPKVSFKEQFLVKTTTLDEWAIQNNIQKVDFLWLDLQGAELKILKSASNMLKNVRAICTEVSLIENYEKGELYPVLKDWLQSKGFKVIREELAWKDGGNVFFAKT